MQNDLKNELKQNFIEYAVSVNSDRSIPDTRSGLKPVARRILFGAYDKGRSSNKPHVKCARIVGDVMAELHPHGDTSIYGALVRLSQPWVMRYPLIDFHGNQGSISGDEAAAYRYTEARLAKITEDGLLSGLKKDNVDFVPNYDETCKEPVTLPSIFPNLLCNPNEGIGVAMSCKWAPHNLREVAQAINDYLDGKEPMLPGPDFPTGGIVINKDDIPSIMKTGKGTVRIRGKYRIESKTTIVFYEIPYGQTIEGLLDEIGKVCDADIPEVETVRDETNKKGIRIVIECKKETNLGLVASKIYAKTNMQTSFSYNMVGLIGKTPTELNLKDCIEIYVKHNIECIVREARFDKDKALARLEVINGLLVALADIDNVIQIIKKAESSASAKKALVKQYNFTETQVTAILNMKLSALARLEGVKLEDEYADLYQKVDELTELIEDEGTQIEELRARLNKIVADYGDDRRTELIQVAEPKIVEKTAPKIVPEDVVVIITQNGEVKRVPRNDFKPQRRAGKGIKNEELVLSTISTNTTDSLLIFTTEGKMFRLPVNDIPAGTKVSRGVQLSTLLKMNPSEKVLEVISQDIKIEQKYIVFFTKKGLVKKTALEEFQGAKKKAGIQAIKIKEGDSLANAVLLNEEDIIAVTKKGSCIRFTSKDVSATGRVTSGVKAIKLKEDDEILLGLVVTNNKDNVGIFTKNGYGKRLDLLEIPKQTRGGVGISISSSEIVGALFLNDTDEIFVSGLPNSICIKANTISQTKRAALGVHIIKDSLIQKTVKL